MDVPPNETQLVAQAQAGDQNALSALYEAYSHAIFQYVSYRVDGSMLAEDITAEVFLRMVRGLPDYEERGLPFGAWLFRIAANLVHEYHRRRRKVTFTALSDLERHDSTDPIERLSRQEERERLRQALSTLPRDQQDVLILRFMQNLSHADVAAILGKSELAIRSIQHRALKALGDKLDAPGKQRSYFRGKQS